MRARTVSRFQECRAVKYGERLASKAFQMMDDELKVAVEYTIRELRSQKERGTLHSLTWSELMSHFSGSKFLLCDRRTTINKQDHFIAHQKPLKHTLATFLSKKVS